MAGCKTKFVARGAKRSFAEMRSQAELGNEGFRKGAPVQLILQRYGSPQVAVVAGFSLRCGVPAIEDASQAKACDYGEFRPGRRAMKRCRINCDLNRRRHLSLTRANSGQMLHEHSHDGSRAIVIVL